MHAHVKSINNTDLSDRSDRPHNHGGYNPYGHMFSSSNVTEHFNKYICILCLTIEIYFPLTFFMQRVDNSISNI